MCRKILLLMALASTLGARAQRIGYIEPTQSWYYIYDENGKRVRSFSTSQGRLVAYTATFYIIRQGDSYYVIYDASGKRITSLGVNVVGEILSASGDTFVSRNASWIYTWTKEGKRIASRSAHLNK